jgi:dCMP deaminase
VEVVDDVEDFSGDNMTESEIKWAKYFFDLIKVIRSKSKDTSTQVGCVIVGSARQIISTGFNDFPFGVENKPERRERPAKYQWTEHAERNAIYLATRSGVSTDGCTIYMMGLPCIDCARGIIQSGIKKLIYDKTEWAKWTSVRYAANVEMALSLEMLKESGVEVIAV